ncbi:MAG: HAMP domain-containing histidine kinase [Deltaproteobacteria bacterium]|nr:HAMP domain-containing histidine kinase [Deltaproteobacteria bacterium]
MKLRLKSRLALTLAIAIVPFAVVVALFQVRAQRLAFEEQTANLVRERMQTGERVACEAQPDLWPVASPPPRFARGNRTGRRGRPDRHGRANRGGRRRLPRDPARAQRLYERRMQRIQAEMERRAPELAYYAYGADFTSDNAAAPEFPEELRQALGASEPHASQVTPTDPRMHYIAARMPWGDGPCAIVIVRRPGVPSAQVFRRALMPALLMSLLAVVLAIFAAGPIVRRINRLTAAVRANDDAPDARVALKGGDEIADLARAFDERRRRIGEQVSALEARDETLSSYVANTTHDVMLPLTVIQGHLSSVERDLEAGKQVDAPRITQALEECHYLGSLVHNLNVAAKLETGEAAAEMHPLDLGEVVERVFGRNAPYAGKRDVRLAHAVPGEPTMVTADVTLIEQAVGNVVHNAIRYNKARGHVAVVLEADDASFTLKVIDDGPGLPAAELSRITERGYRGDRARSRHPTGSGLGLAITKDVCIRHGFDLTFDDPDTEEGGLLVTIQGPLRPALTQDN